jgi:adenylyltransferase/sulfurtransferase
MLTPTELQRYQRHLILPGFGKEGQERLRAARVLVVGAGGLGCPLLLYLAAAGVGEITLMDPDVVSESNLQRQVLYTTEDLGQPKAEAAARRLTQLNPQVVVKPLVQRLDAACALEVLQGHHLVADGADNFATRYLVNDAAILSGIPNVYASIFRWEGQVSVFNLLRRDGSRGPNYRDLYPSPPPAGEVLSCAEGGVLGVLPGIVGSLQAAEVIKVLTGIGETLDGRLLLFDALSMRQRVLTFDADPRNPLTGESPSQQGLIDYEAFCGTAFLEPSPQLMQEIIWEDLETWRSKGLDFLLIDVREAEEYAQTNAGGKLIPLGKLDAALETLPREIPLVVHCQSGMRSAKAADLLIRAGFEQVFNVLGGLNAR